MDINGFEIDEYNVHGIKQGATAWICPLCSESRSAKNKKQKCMSINWELGLGHCNHCGEKVQLHTFKKKREMKEYLKPQKRSEKPFIPQKVATHSLIDRGISRETLEKMGITISQQWMPKAQKVVPVMEFPYKFQGELVNVKYRGPNKDFKFEKGCELIMYNLDSILYEDSCVIVEGEWDALAYVEAGVKNVTSVPNGFTLPRPDGTSSVNLRFLDKYYQYFENKQRIYLAVDNDEPGNHGKQELVRRFGEEKCWLVDFKDCKDANEYLVKYGKEALSETIDNATQFPRTGKPGAIRGQVGNKSEEEDEMVSNVLAIRFPVKLTKSEEKECGDFVRKYGFLSWKNITYIGKIRDGEMTFEPKSNFSMIPHYLVTDEEGKTNRIIEFTNSKKERRIDHITTDAFVSVDAFAKYVERGNFWSLFDRREWTKVKSWLYEVTPAAKEINTLGQQEDGFFAFSNGILADGEFHEINNLGIVSLKGKNYFFPALSDIYRNNRMTYQFEREFIHTKRNVAFGTWAELFCKVYGENGRIGLMYCCMAMFSDIIFKTDGFFPMLYLYGKPESGKSTMAYSILSLLHKTEGKSVGSNINSVSMAALFRKLGQVRNGMVLLEEYNNELDTKQVEILKQIWNRDAYLKADSSQSNTSNRTVSHQIESSVVITGQHLPVADVALFTRVILLQFFKNDGFSEESMELISDLKTLQNESLTQIATSILKHRPKMEENYASNYKYWKKRYAKRFVGTNVSRIGQHCAIVMAIYQTLSGKLNFPFLEEELRISLEKIAEAQNGMMQNSEESSQFWEAMAYLVHSGILEENRQFTFREMNQIAVRRDTAKSETVYNFPQLSEVMFIRLNQIQPVYAKEMRQRGQKYMDSDTLRSYLKNSPAYIGEKKSMKFGESNSSAMVFNYSLLQEDFSLRKIAFMADTSETQLMTPDHLEVKNEIVPF